MKVRTQQNFNQKTHETVFGISIMPDGGRRYCKYPIGHQEYKDYAQAHQAMKDVQKISNNRICCKMKLNKKTEQLIKLRAAELKKLYETPNPEVDKIISELRAEATKRPQNMRKEEEIAYILKKADENCDHIEIRKILNVSNT